MGKRRRLIRTCRRSWFAIGWQAIADRGLMRFFHSERQLLHRPPQFLLRGQPRPSPEVPERSDSLVEALRRRGVRIEDPEAFGPDLPALVHTPEYLRFLATAHERWRALPDASPAVIPNVHRNSYMDGYPTSVVGQAGWHMADTACPIVEGTWPAASAAATVAASAARCVADGDAAAAYALCRPPGHHAYADMAGGFCYLNNVAIAAELAIRRLRMRGRAGRVAVLDVDVHHGNGTQGIFYRRPDVFFVSVHADPATYYPFYSGYAAERGAGDGLGYTLNLPLPLGTDEDRFLAAVAEAGSAIRIFAPDLLLVSLGFDTFVGDPLVAFHVTTPGYARLGAALAGLGIPSVIVQEGGYAVDALGDNLASFLDGFTA